jgi:hypothetical protein
MDRTEEALGSILQRLSHHFASTYEKVAVEVLWGQMQRFFPFAAVGKWWERNEEIDIVALNREIDCILFGEVKWSEKPIGTDIFETLKEKTTKVNWGSKQRKEHFCLFSKSGFTQAMIRKAREEGIALFKEDALQEVK